MNRLAMSVAVVGLLVLAGVGWLSDLPPLTCAIRAAVGAAVLFVVTRVGARMALSLIVDEVIRSATRDREAKDSTGERRT